MDTQGSHHPDERDAWFRGEALAAFPASRRPPAPGSWTPEADPLTGPLPPESDVRASLAEAQEEASRANPSAEEQLGGAPVSSPTGGFETYQPGLVRQHAERVPRYPAQSGPVSAPPSSAPPVSAAPAPQADQPAQEPGIPASLAPMLSHDDSGHTPRQEQYTEPLSRAALAEAAPHPLDAPQPLDAPHPFDAPQLDAPPVDASAGEQAPPAVPSFPPAPEFGGVPPQQAAPLHGAPQQTAPQQIVPPPTGPGGRQMPAPQAQPTAYHSMGSQQTNQSGGGNAAVLAAVVLCTLLATVPSVLLLYKAALDGPGISAAGVVAATLMLIGLPLLAAGLYPLLSGGLASAPLDGWRALLRPPLAYLIVGLILLLSAGLAAG